MRILLLIFVATSILSCQKSFYGFPVVKSHISDIKLINLKPTIQSCRFESGSFGFDSLQLCSIIPKTAMEYYYDKRLLNNKTNISGQVRITLMVNDKGKAHILNYVSQLSDTYMDSVVQSKLTTNFWGECKNQTGFDTINLIYQFLPSKRKY